MLRSGGQIRAVPGALLGFDMTAVLAMATALGIPGALVCEFMPGLEAEMVKSAAKDADSDGGKAGIGQDQG